MLVKTDNGYLYSMNFAPDIILLTSYNCFLVNVASFDGIWMHFLCLLSVFLWTSCSLLYVFDLAVVCYCYSIGHSFTSVHCSCPIFLHWMTTYCLWPSMLLIERLWTILYYLPFESLKLWIWIGSCLPAIYTNFQAWLPSRIKQVLSAQCNLYCIIKCRSCGRRYVPLASYDYGAFW